MCWIESGRCVSITEVPEYRRWCRTGCIGKHRGRSDTDVGGRIECRAGSTDRYGVAAEGVDATGRAGGDQGSGVGSVGVVDVSWVRCGGGCSVSERPEIAQGRWSGGCIRKTHGGRCRTNRGVGVGKGRIDTGCDCYVILATDCAAAAFVIGNRQGNGERSDAVERNGRMLLGRGLSISKIPSPTAVDGAGRSPTRIRELNRQRIAPAKSVGSKTYRWCRKDTYVQAAGQAVAAIGICDRQFHGVTARVEVGGDRIGQRGAVAVSKIPEIAGWVSGGGVLKIDDQRGTSRCNVRCEIGQRGLAKQKNCLKKYGQKKGCPKQGRSKSICFQNKPAGPGGVTEL